MKINKLIVCNFRTYLGNYEFDFKDKELIIVSGPNGHGKSALFDAIEWCILGEIERYKGSREEQNFNYVANIKSKSESYVELKLVEDENAISIKRCLIFDAYTGKYLPTIYINDVPQRNISSGNLEIKQLLCDDSIDEQINQNISFKEYFKSTQILAQDTLKDFITNNKPQDRYKIMESILGLDKYGTEFKEYCNKVSGSLKEQLEELNKKYKGKDEEKIEQENEKNIKQYKLEIEKQIIKSKGIKTKEELINDINTFVSNENEPLKVNIIDTDNSILEKLDQLQTRVSEEILCNSNNKQKVQEYKGQLECSKIVTKTSIDTAQEQINIINNKIKSINESLDKSNVVIEEIKRLQEGNKLYEKYEKIGEKISKEIQLLEDNKKSICSLLENEIEELGNINDAWLAEYENSLVTIRDYDICKQVNLKNEYIEKKALESKQLTDKISVNEKNIYALTEQYNLLTKKREEYNNSVKLIEEDDIQIIIKQIQNRLIEDKRQKKCLVCGHMYEEHLALEDAIQNIIKEVEEKHSIEKNKAINMMAESTEVHKQLSSIQDQQSEIKKKLYNVEKEIESEQKQLLELRIKIVGEVPIQENKYFEAKEYVKRFSKMYSFSKYLSEKDTLIIKKGIEDNKNKEEIKKVLIRFNNDNRVMDNDELIKSLESELILLTSLKTEFVNNNIELQRAESDLELLNRKKVSYDLIISRIQEYINDFDGKSQMFEKYFSDIDSINQKLIKQKEKISFMYNEYNLFVHNNTYIDIVADIDIRTKKIQQINSEMKEIKDKIDALKMGIDAFQKIIPVAKEAQSKFVAKYMKRYRDDIDRLFVQITPHMYNSHINILVKQGNIYFLLDNDKINNETLEQMEDAELKNLANASLTLSSAQANVLAVCIFIALNMTQRCTNLKFIGIDDPFQNMDDINTYSFIDVLTNIINNKQMMISTHSDKFAKLLYAKSGLEKSKIGIIRIDSLKRGRINISGNCVVLQSNNLSESS